MGHPLGQSVRLTFSTFSDVDETTPADPTSLTLVVTKPDETTETFTWPTPATIIRSGLGVFYKDYTGATAGTYLFRWAAAGAVVSVATGQFDVLPQTRYIVSLEDLKEHLNDTSMSAESEVKLEAFAAAATKVVEHLCTTVVPVDVTEYPHVYGGLVVLDNRHVISVDTVHESVNGTLTALTEDTFTAPGATSGYRRERNRIYRTAGGADTLFTAGARVRVVYTAGLEPMPQDVELAAKELVRFWWQPSQYGVMSEAGPLGRSSGGTGTILVAGFLVPNAVLALLAEYRRGPMAA